MKRLSVVVLLLLLVALGGAPAAQKEPPLRLFPRLSQGQVLRYRISYHRASSSSTASMVRNPVSEVNSELSVSLGMRLEVIEVVPPEAGRADGQPVIRLRATYERAEATQRSDDPTADDRAAEKEIAQLEGKSFECAVRTNGVEACAAPGESVPGAAEGMQRWLTEVLAAASLPRKGISPGENWGDEQDAGAEIPLAGLRWVRKFTYFGEKPCGELPAEAGRNGAKDSPGGESCAEIRVRSLLLRKGGRKDATPEAFREKGLRTAGTASGANESVILISLASGLTVRAADTGWQTADFTVSATKGAAKIRMASQIKTDSALSQVRDVP
jgi:hypothetical protein